MDSVSNKKAGGIKSDAKSKGRGKNPSLKTKKSRTLKKSPDCKKGATCRNVKKIAKEKVKKSLYQPVHEQLSMLIGVIDILDGKKDGESLEEIHAFHGLMSLVMRQSLMYLSYNYSRVQGERW